MSQLIGVLRPFSAFYCFLLAARPNLLQVSATSAEDMSHWPGREWAETAAASPVTSYSHIAVQGSTIDGKQRQSNVWRSLLAFLRSTIYS